MGSDAAFSCPPETNRKNSRLTLSHSQTALHNMTPTTKTITISRSHYEQLLAERKALHFWELRVPFLILSGVALFILHFLTA